MKPQNFKKKNLKAYLSKRNRENTHINDQNYLLFNFKF